jgi:hypothetical protein
MHGSRLAAVVALGACFVGCSCGGGRAALDGAVRDAAAQDRGPELDAASGDSSRPEAGGRDACVSDPAHPEQAWACALDVPWGPDGTRPLTPIEIPAAVAATDCGPGCKEVTFLPGARQCLSFGDPFGADGNYLTTAMCIPAGPSTTRRCFQTYVNLATSKAYAFGSMFSVTSFTCAGNGVVSQGQIAYAIGGGRTTDEHVTEIRLFDIATQTERRLWSGSGVSQADIPLSLTFAGQNLGSIMSPGCPACTTAFAQPLAGGDRSQIYPPAGQDTGGLGNLRASYPYAALDDSTRFQPTLGLEVVALDLRQPDQPIDLSNAVGDQWRPRISGTRVVWMDTRNDLTHDYSNYRNSDIYLKDIVTREERAICTDPAQQDNPDIEGDLVVWLDCRHMSNPTPGPYGGACQEPYVYNLTTGVATPVQMNSALYRDALRINGGRLFLQATDWVNPPQIYMIDLAALGLAGSQ